MDPLMALGLVNAALQVIAQTGISLQALAELQARRKAEGRGISVEDIADLRQQARAELDKI